VFIVALPLFGHAGFNYVAPSQQEIIDAWDRYNALADLLAIAQAPKNHLLIHMVDRARSLGSPSCYSCWQDEGLNRMLKLVLRGCHSHNFECMAFAKTAPLLAKRQAKPPAKRRRMS
jgi:hypothetical protein